MPIKITLALSFLLIGFCSIVACAQPNPSPKAQIDSLLSKANRQGLFNGAVLIVENRQVVLRKAIGFADASKQVLLTPDYRFHIGSVAKEFDAVAIMMLVEEGKLALDDKIVQFFPQLPDWAKQISVRHLLQYTSGLPEVNYSVVRSDADNWKDLVALRQLNAEPGNRYAYTNNNTFLRRQLVQTISGLPFDEFVAQKMFKRAGIKAGVVDPTDATPLMAKSFTKDFKQAPLQAPISGWTCVNVDDLYSWSESLNGFKLIGPESTKLILTPFGPDQQAGLGKGTMQANRLLTHIHDGSALRYQALLMVDTTKGRTIILLTNQKQDNVYELGQGIATILDQS